MGSRRPSVEKRKPTPRRHLFARTNHSSSSTSDLRPRVARNATPSLTQNLSKNIDSSTYCDDVDHDGVDRDGGIDRDDGVYRSGARHTRQLNLGADNKPMYASIRERPFKNNKFWFLEHRHFVKTSFLWKVTLIVTFIQVVLMAVAYLIEQQKPDFDAFDPECSSLEISRFFLYGFAGMSKSQGMLFLDTHFVFLSIFGPLDYLFPI